MGGSSKNESSHCNKSMNVSKLSLVYVTLIGAGLLSGSHETFAFLFPTLTTHRIQQRQDLASWELAVKRKSNKDKLKRWGGGGGKGFGSDDESKEPKPPAPTNNRSVNKKDISLPNSSSVAKEPTASKSETSSQVVSELPRLTGAEIARLNTLSLRQREEQDWSLRFRNEYLEQQLLAMNSHPRQVNQISSDPLLFVIDDFIDPEACRQVDNQANGCFHLLFPETVADRLFQGQESEQDGLLFNLASSKDHAQSPTPYPDGLHMDTNNQCLFRHVTCILYLNDVPEDCGGATVFPIARALPEDPALKAAQRLLDHSISHTKSREIVTLGLEEEARQLESRVQTNCVEDPLVNTAIRIQPKAGRLLVFFSREAQGRQDPRTWHAGERIQSQSSSSSADDGGLVEKRILTLFKQVDYDKNDEQHFASANRFNDFLAPQCSQQREWLQAKAKLQKALLSEISE